MEQHVGRLNNHPVLPQSYAPREKERLSKVAVKGDAGGKPLEVCFYILNKYYNRDRNFVVIQSFY